MNPAASTPNTSPAPSSPPNLPVLPQLRAALAGRVTVEQPKGFLRERLDVPVEEAFTLMRAYARHNGEHLTEVARRLVTERHGRPTLLAALTDLAAPPE